MVLTGEFSWTQTQTDVTVSVPLKRASVRSVDVYASSCYVKVNYRPYLLNLDLHGFIDEATEVLTVKDGVLVLNYQKLDHGDWPDLVCANHKDRKQMQERRYAAMEDKTKRTQEQAKKMRDRRIEDERRSTRMQMAVDEAERQQLEDLKAEEKEEAERKVYEAFRELEQSKQSREDTAPSSPLSMMETIPQSGHLKVTPSETQVQDFSTKADGPKSILKPCSKTLERIQGTRERHVSFGEERVVSFETTEDDRKEEAQLLAATSIIEVKDEDQIFSDEDLGADVSAQESHVASKACTESGLRVTCGKEQNIIKTKKNETDATTAAGDDDLEAVLPPPRSSVRMKVAFTARVFPTPMRESRKEEEEDWLLRNRRHITGKARERLDTVDISERDPFWLKGKGDDFFRSSNFEGAVNAYSCALEIDPKMASCLSNRAACFLKLGHHDRCVQDCDEALSVLKQEREEELALAQREGFSDEPKEFRRTKEMRKKLHIRKGTALRHQEQYTPALAEYQRAQELAPNDDDLKADCARLLCLVQCTAQKDLGDNAFRRKAFEEALKYYNKALDYDLESVTVLSNRAACYMCMEHFEEARVDCVSALGLLEARGVENEHGHLPRSAKQTEVDLGLKLKLWKRAGLLAQKLSDWGEMERSFRKALDLDETNLELAKLVKLAQINQATA